MSKHFSLLSALLLSTLAVGAAAPAAAVAAPLSVTVPAPAKQSRIGGRSFGRSPFGSRYRSRYRSPYRRTYARRSPFHGLGGTILKVLGISYLFHMLFGIGAGGGSPFGLLILVALMAYALGRARRPRRMSY
jgi:uncharacterized membrane protein